MDIKKLLEKIELERPVIEEYWHIEVEPGVPLCIEMRGTNPQYLALLQKAVWDKDCPKYLLLCDDTKLVGKDGMMANAAYIKEFFPNAALVSGPCPSAARLSLEEELAGVKGALQ